MVCPFAALSSVASLGPLARPTVSGPGASAGGCTQLDFMDAGIGWSDDPRWGLENEAGGPLEPPVSTTASTTTAAMTTATTPRRIPTCVRRRRCSAARFSAALR